ncbi:hypothetical protein ACNJX9_35005 [Bradyrhizobium sp. DASA03076]|uniref:hypothetical protein n=1 Tax=Bradyrhizobium sp. BLXBL-03 TaxID=3395916 RepID=UPI003F6EAE43
MYVRALNHAQAGVGCTALTIDHTGPRADADELHSFYSGPESEASARWRSSFDAPLVIERSAEIRCSEQSFEVGAPLADLVWEWHVLVAELEDQFHQKHEGLYIYALRGQEVVLVDGRVSAIDQVSRKESLPHPRLSRPLPQQRWRNAYFNSWQEVPISSFEDLPSRCKIDGLAYKGGDDKDHRRRARLRHSQ